jgi:hypothetical protein
MRTGNKSQHGTRIAAELLGDIKIVARLRSLQQHRLPQGALQWVRPIDQWAS